MKDGDENVVFANAVCGYAMSKPFNSVQFSSEIDDHSMVDMNLLKSFQAISHARMQLTRQVTDVRNRIKPGDTSLAAQWLAPHELIYGPPPPERRREANYPCHSPWLAVSPRSGVKFMGQGDPGSRWKLLGSTSTFLELWYLEPRAWLVYSSPLCSNDRHFWIKYLVIFFDFF